MLLRYFTERGISQFRAFLNSYQSGTASPDDVDKLVTNTDLSNRVDPRVSFEMPRLASKRELAQTVCKAFQKAGYQDLPMRNSSQDRGMWTWLAATAFHLIKPQQIKSGKPHLRDYSYYIMSDRTFRFYRHRVAGPARIHWMYRDRLRDVRLLLHGNLYSVSEFEERIAGYPRTLSNRELVAVANRLYFDPMSASPKRGAQNSHQRGVLRRFATVTSQLDLTYDLHRMSANQIFDLLPPEFDRWKK